MSNFLSIDHTSIIVSDTDEALKFYQGVLGMERLQRALLPYPGAWLKIGTQQLHLLELPDPDQYSVRPDHGGRDRHMAILVSDINVIKKAMQENAIQYTMSQSGRPALFCRDSDQNALEFIQA